MRAGILLASWVLCAAAAQAGGVKIRHNSDALEFAYSWPAQAARVPAINGKFRADAQKAYRQALELGRENQSLYREEKREGVRDFFLMQWRVAGQSARLLSLQNQVRRFTGGAHSNTGFGAMLWDKSMNEVTKLSALFIRPSDLSALSRDRYCHALEAERLKRRGGEKLGGEFDECPKFDDLAIAPVDKNRNGRFDEVDFLASPYIAGPYAEGEYEIMLPVTAKMISSLKPRYRASFEAQRQ